jgi:hypothetical protein
MTKPASIREQIDATAYAMRNLTNVDVPIVQITLAEDVFWRFIAELDLDAKFHRAQPKRTLRDFAYAGIKIEKA